MEKREDPTLAVSKDELNQAFKKIYTAAKGGDAEATEIWAQVIGLRGGRFDDEGNIANRAELVSWEDMTQEAREKTLQLLKYSPPGEKPEDPTLKIDPETRKAPYRRIRAAADQGDEKAKEIMHQIFELRGGEILDDGSVLRPEGGLTSWEDMSRGTREKILQLLKYSPPGEEPEEEGVTELPGLDLTDVEPEPEALPVEERKVWRYMTRDEDGALGLTELKSAEEIREDIKNKILNLLKYIEFF